MCAWTTCACSALGLDDTVAPDDSASHSNRHGLGDSTPTNTNIIAPVHEKAHKKNTGQVCNKQECLILERRKFQHARATHLTPKQNGNLK